MKKSNWKNKYNNLKEYYLSEYLEKYYNFDPEQFTIDPDETLEDLELYSLEQQTEEIIKCAKSFSYFCHKFVKISHKLKGKIPFIIFAYQKKAIKCYENNRFNIMSKFRQGGLTTLTVLYFFWRCMFKTDETMMVISKSDREAVASAEHIDFAIDELPSWLRPPTNKNNLHQKVFEENNSKILFYTANAARSRSLSWLFIDEAAFIPKMEKHWAGLFPTIATGGNCIIVSTVNGIGNWYEKAYTESKKGEKLFNVIDIDYWENPEYDKPEWVNLIRAQLGEKLFKQEILRDFLGSVETYISNEILGELELATKEASPIRVLFPEYTNHEERSLFLDGKSPHCGALHIFKEVVPGHDYVIGVDVAEGIGSEGDNSCFQIINITTKEQVAEFYSNKIPIKIFSQILNQIGLLYNYALIVVERVGLSITVINKLSEDLYYTNLFNDNGKFGVKTSSQTRPILMEKLQDKLIEKSLKIKSQRLVRELRSFIFDVRKKKAQAAPGCHDDAILALCMAIYGWDCVYKELPINELIEQNHSMPIDRAEVYDLIRQELKKGMEETLVYQQYKKQDIYRPVPMQRPNEKLLKEFGW